MTPDVALASMVAVTPPGRWGSRCVAWVDSRDSECGRDVKQGFLCARHYTVACRRLDRERAKRQDQAVKRAQHREENMPGWRDELALIDREISRRTAPITTDRAFSGGVGAEQHRKHLKRQFSDSNVKRVGELIRRRERLQALMGDQE